MVLKEPKVIQFNDMNIQNKMIKCEINYFSTFIICFYHSKDNLQNLFQNTIFIINDMNLSIKQTSEIPFDRTLNEINQIKLAKSFNDKFFICILNKDIPSCFINENSIEFKEINCIYPNDDAWSSEYKVFYFNETHEFMHISRSWLNLTIINNFGGSTKQCLGRIDYLNFPQINDFSIIYINEIQKYKIVNSEDFKNYNNCINLDIFEKIKHTEYTEKIKDFICNTTNKDELMININEVIKNEININYIDNDEELIIQKDGITIAFTSTHIQKLNENNNSTTINLGKCENYLKTAYNISEESNLYMLKIDTPQEYKNYPLIEYEIFYPLSNGKMEILNLSFCEGTNIELSIPIDITGTFDIYNPKSNYYNNICSKATSENNTDIPLNDRKNEFIKNNLSLCEENCELIGYNNTNKKAKCSCNVKTDVSLDRIELDKNFLTLQEHFALLLL